ncbi:hypothetical protein PLESTB_000451800 [Pleodorina starrii]|uniref:Proton pump-interactor 1 n=1 Tax=Pleodorina starrii TaxID=330485 RepID=A0A9W6EZN9_9CHLO|nr:hypothetical protein PLESTM_000753200 [Pleodorina starrii]GLC50967.1 hypothetical protein PLESTB_000451800 [Pleodorina starrii]
MSEDAVLEQRERKPRRAAAPEANGHVSDVPDFAAAEDFAVDVPTGDSTDVPEPEDVEEPSTSTNKIYFVRVPRPPINDEAVKKLSAHFNEQVAKVKGANAKLAAKREELRELRRQLGVGRSLKDGSQPEYEEKVNRLQSLRNLSKTYKTKMSAIRQTLRGLDCKSEEELDAKVKELEDRISFGGLTLREEKLVVGQISKLKSQRVQVRDYANQKTTLDELESENDKVNVVIAELEGEFGILRTERDQASGIIKEILTKVKACEAEVRDLEEEQKEAVSAKNDALATLDKARADMNESMADFRDNRSFSLKVRDLVTAGQVDEARALCGAQTDEIIAKIASDVAYRKEYHSLWAAQRKYAVSELLPDSTTVVKEARPADARASGRADARASKAPPPKPQGAEKARMLIEQFLAEAQQEASRKAAGRAVADDGDVSSGDADDELDLPSSVPAAAPVVEAVKPKAAASARPADLLKYVELPKIDDEEFVPPVIKTEEEKAAAKAAQDKDRQREEQIKKAQEAEARKKKAAEAKEKKRKEVEAKRKAEEEVRKAEAAAQEEERAKRAAVERAEEEAKRKAAQEAAKAAAEAKASYNPAAKVIAKSQVKVVAKAKPPSNDMLRHWKAFKKNTNLQLTILGVVLTVIMLVLVIMAMRS